MERKIIHIDMDAFFASVEQLDNPALRGKPIVVGHDGPRSVVATASYEARPFGVHSAQPIATAKRLCPNLIIVPGHYSRYKEVSAMVHEIFHDYTDLVEPISLDEAFLDVTENKPGIVMAMDIAREIRERIFETTHLTASAGVAHNKLIAKIASDYRKPNGMTVVHPSRAADFVAALPVERLWGVGPKTALRMHELGVKSCNDLRRFSIAELMRHFGKMGRLYYDYCRGIDHRPVINHWQRKSVGCEQTLPTDIETPTQALEIIENLADDLVKRLERSNFEGRSFTLKVKYTDFTQITRSAIQPHVVRSRADIINAAEALLTKVDFTFNPIRLLGLSVSRTDLPAGEHYHTGQWTQAELPFEPY